LIRVVVFRGARSAIIAESLSQMAGVPWLSEQEAFGCDKAAALLLYDGDGVGSFSNQGLLNRQDFPFSVRIHPGTPARRILNQLHADYFRNFSNNVSRRGFPWGSSRTHNKAPFGAYGIGSSLEWERWGGAGELFLMVCPDYPFDRALMRYTNEPTLGTGIGLVALKALEFLEYLDRPIPALIGIADYEDTPENLLRLGESKASFALKLESSMFAIREACRQRNTPADVFGIRARHPQWDHEMPESLAAARNYLRNLPGHVLDQKIKSRMNLFGQWGMTLSKEEALEKMAVQGSEYVNCGMALSRIAVNPLVIGTNSINMASFYKLRNPELPVIYISDVF